MTAYTLSLKKNNIDQIKVELLSLMMEWEEWKKKVDEIQDHLYDVRTQTEVFKDGRSNMDKHDILQAKTLVFLNNNMDGHGFIIGMDGNGVDRTDLRLKVRVQHRLKELKIIEASLPYANVPDSYWTMQAKRILDKVADKAPEVAAEILKEYLKNPRLA